MQQVALNPKWMGQIKTNYGDNSGTFTQEIIFDWQKVLNIVSKKKYFQGYRKLLVDNFIKSIATFRTQ